MVLRFFSRSSASSDSTGDPKKSAAKAKGAASAPAVAADAGPAELAAAARQASSNKERAALVKRIRDSITLKELAKTTGCLAACADQIASIDSVPAALALTSDGATETQIELAIHTHNDELREAQVQAFGSEDALVKLEHASRSKNKACNRLARARLDALRSARLSVREASAEAEQIARQAQRLELDAHLSARFEALQQKHTHARQRYTESLAILEEFAEQAPAMVPMPEAPKKPASQAEETGPDFPRLAAAFDSIFDQITAGTAAADCISAMETATRAWRDAIKLATPDATSIDAVAKSSSLFETIRNCETLLGERIAEITELLARPPQLDANAITKLDRRELPEAWIIRKEAETQRKSISKLTKGISYPAEVAAPPVIAELASRRTLLDDLLKASAARQKEIENKFGEQVKKLETALSAGELKRAEAARSAARSLQDALPGGAANSTRKRYGSLIANMQNLRDWQHFATDPKREELCVKMLAIADNPQEPDEQADLVKELRAQWNALGGKGPKEIAARFDEAATRAFEPCRAHYAALAETRAENLETRKQILQQIERFVETTDWSRADLGGARNILNSARNEWREAFPVERGANKTLEKRFQAATDTLYSNLQEGWSENLSAKEELVARAEALITSSEPLPERLSTAKTLQQQWKTAGPVPRGPDQKLWKRFRTACDALFNTRDEERSALQAEYAAQQQAATARLDEFEKLIEITQPMNLDRSSLSVVKSELDAIANLDRSVIARARDLEKLFQEKLGQKAAAVKTQKLALLKKLDALAATSELAGEPVPEEVTAQDARFANRNTGAANAHLDLVLDAETQAGIESPAVDAQRRLELQVEKLNAGMNSGARKSAGPLELADQWCAMRANEESKKLSERLFTAVETLLAR